MINQSKPRPHISVLMYHQVGRFKEPTAHRSCYCDVDRFRHQMAFLRYAGYKVVSLKDAHAALFESAPLPGRSVVLSFDDGYRNFEEYALPILKDFGYPAIVFAISGHLGQPASWLDDGGANSRLLSGERLLALKAAGFEIGSHTINHSRLSRLPPEQAWQEISGSKSALEDLLGESVDFFAYPFGDYNPAMRDAVMRSGYKGAVTCSRGAAATAPNPFEIPRKAISYGDNLFGFFWKLAVKNRRKDRHE